MSSRLIVVFGASGAQGSSVAEALVEQGWKVRGVTRDPTRDDAKKMVARGVEMVKGSMESSVEELRPLFRGAYGAFVVTVPGFIGGVVSEKDQGFKMVEAAKQEGIQHFVFSSLPNVEVISKGKWDVSHFTEKALVEEKARAAGFPFASFFSPSFYYSNFKSFFPPTKDDSGNWSITLPKTSKLTMFDVADSGGVVAAIFKDPEGNNGKFIPTVGDELTPKEIVDIISKASGKSVNLVEIPVDVFATFGAPGAEEIANMFGWFTEFTLYGPHITDLEAGRRLYPNLKSFEAWAKDSFKDL